MVVTTRPVDGRAAAGGRAARLSGRIRHPRPDARGGRWRAICRQRLDDARALGAAVRAVAVVRAEHGAPGSVEIELIDLATGKALVVSVPRPQRDEDLYRALALKIQAVLRATLSEARADFDPGSSLGRLVEQRRRTAAGAARRTRRAGRARRRLRRRVVPERRAAVRRARGPGGMAAAAERSSWRWEPRRSGRPARRPARSTRRRRSSRCARPRATPFAVGRVQLFVGPCAEATYIRVATSSATTRSARRGT